MQILVRDAYMGGKTTTRIGSILVTIEPLPRMKFDQTHRERFNETLDRLRRLAPSGTTDVDYCGTRNREE